MKNTDAMLGRVSLVLLLVASLASPAGASVETSASRPSADATAEFARSNNALGFDLYDKARLQPGNLALAPISISTVLVMTWAGARTDTAAQMQKVLHADATVESVLPQASRLLADLQRNEGGAEIHIVNRLFGAEQFGFDAHFLDQTRKFFGATLEPMNFARPEQSRRHINAWVAQQTQDRIPQLLPQAAINEQSRLVLVNAIYFLGHWIKPFSANSTVPVPFHISADDTHAVPMMHQVSTLRFGHTDGVKLLALPYRGEQLEMLLVLPDTEKGLEEVERRLSQDVFDRWLGAMNTLLVQVALPKFEVSTPQSLPLGGALRSLGMPLAFDAEHADFGAIATPASATDRLHVGEVFHQAFVKVDELGTTAAAATAVLMVETGAVPPSGPVPEQFRADHPFLFVLRHLPSGTILFIGRVSDPLGVRRH